MDSNRFGALGSDAPAGCLRGKGPTFLLALRSRLTLILAPGWPCAAPKLAQPCEHAPAARRARPRVRPKPLPDRDDGPAPQPPGPGSGASVRLRLRPGATAAHRATLCPSCWTPASSCNCNCNCAPVAAALSAPKNNLYGYIHLWWNHLIFYIVMCISSDLLSFGSA